MKIYNTKSNNLEKLMIAFKLGDNELSEAIGLPSTTIWRLKKGETGDPTLSTLKMIARYFKVSIGQLVCEEPLGPDLTDCGADRAIFSKIPVLDWGQLIESEKLLPSLTLQNHLSWTYTDTGPNTFGLIIETEEYGSIFPKNALVFVSHSKEKIDPVYVIVAEKKSKKTAIFKMITSIPDYLAHPTNTSMSFPFDESRYKIIGYILGVNTRFKS